MADKYILSVTAGPNYEEQKQVPVNTSEVTRISSDQPYSEPPSANTKLPWLTQRLTEYLAVLLQTSARARLIFPLLQFHIKGRYQRI